MNRSKGALLAWPRPPIWPTKAVKTVTARLRASTIERDRLRTEVGLALDTPEAKQRAVNNCLECHDLDNSPEFDFDTYWPQVEHSEQKAAEIAPPAAANAGG